MKGRDREKDYEEEAGSDGVPGSREREWDEYEPARRKKLGLWRD